MKRKFYINMYQKGRFKKQLQSKIDLVVFSKTNIKQIEIMEFEEELIKDYLKNNYEICFLYILGINKNNPYRNRNLMREILNENKEGYKAINLKQVTKETEKAYFVDGLESWIAKSQSIKENDILYIKEWLFFKSLM